MQGGAGHDIYFIDAVGDSVSEFTNHGNDQVRTPLSRYVLPANVEELLFTGVGDFQGTGNAMTKLIVGGGGNDVLIAGAVGSNELIGGGGDDTYYVSSPATSIVEYANEGYDTIRTDLSTYTMAGAVEALVYIGQSAFYGVGQGSDDVLAGGNGNDELYGLAGNDTLIGNGGRDYLFGSDGNDLLNGGAGNDRLIGGAGGDQFVFADVGIDTITDFAAGSDRIFLDHAMFAGLTVGALAAGAFVRGNTALDADDRILYEAATGHLFYDADGSGASVAIQFGIASVPIGILSAADFLVT